MCTKTTYRSERIARRAARVLKGETGLPFRAYPCPDCRQWHLSTGELRDTVRLWPHHKRGRRPKQGQTIEDLAEQMRGE